MRMITLVAALMPMAATAQTDVMTAEICTQLTTHLETDLGYDVEIGGHMAEDQLCVLGDILVRTAANYGPDIRIKRMAISGSGFEAFFADMTPLRTAIVDIDDLQVLPRVGDPVYDYMLEVQQHRNLNDIDISVSWDPATNVLIMDRFEIDLPGENAISATLRVENADLSSLGALEMSLTGMAVTDLNLEVTSHELFENYLAPMLIPALLGSSGDPEQEVEEMKAMALGLLGQVPETILAAASLAAMAELMADIPHPAGTITLEMRANPGIGAVRFGPMFLFRAPETLAEVWPLFEGVTFDIGYERTSVE